MGGELFLSYAKDVSYLGAGGMVSSPQVTMRGSRGVWGMFRESDTDHLAMSHVCHNWPVYEGHVVIHIEW